MGVRFVFSTADQDRSIIGHLRHASCRLLSNCTYKVLNGVVFLCITAPVKAHHELLLWP
jgi:hypothetical protein